MSRIRPCAPNELIPSVTFFRLGTQILQKCGANGCLPSDSLETGLFPLLNSSPHSHTFLLREGEKKGEAPD